MLQRLQYIPKVGRFVQRKGLRHAGRVGGLVARNGWMGRIDHRREAPFGVDTGGVVDLGELAIDSDNRKLGFASDPSPGLLVATLIHSVPEDLSRFKFIDFGSGKGRALLVAAHFRFAEIIGVEFSPELHELAAANIRGYLEAERPCESVRSVCADAAAFEVPDGDLVLYFNNPFAEPVFSQVLSNIRQAHQRDGRKIYVLYQRLAEGLETDRTNNVALLRHSGFLEERPIEFPSPLARFLLAPYELRVFASTGHSPVGSN
jgi:SAM-dependent methyltransferase